MRFSTIENMSNLKITSCYFDDLPEWVDKSMLPNNGSGKEYATYLVIEDGDYRSVRSDAMEPEDARFGRDLKWIIKELYRASGQ
jgi:hypothetical protein